MREDQVTGTELAVRDEAAAPVPARQPPIRARSPYWVYLRSLDGAESARTMRGCADRLAVLIAPSLAAVADPGEFIPWHDITYAYATELRGRITEKGWAPAYANKHLSALRCLLREAWKLGLMDADSYQRAADIKNVKGSRLKKGRSIAGDEVRAVLEACDGETGPIAVRDKAMTAVLYSTGIRRAEVSGALIEKYDAARRSLAVIGKGDKERLVYLHASAVPYLSRWLALVGEQDGPIFRPVDKWGNIKPRAMSDRAVGAVVARRCAQARIPRTTTHDYRRTWIGDFLDSGGDLVIAQRIAGHARVGTTAEYDRRPEAAKRTAVDKMAMAALDGG